jgi:uncharacterized membrane protein
MHALWDELRNVPLWAALIETAAGLVIAGYCTAAFWSVVRRADRTRAKVLVAEGALAGLGFIVCASLLKTLLLSSWRQIGIFGCVLVLRTALKRIFAAEQAGIIPHPIKSESGPRLG